MDFDLPADLLACLAKMDQFIDDVIKPIEREDDNIRFFDHRREWARTDFDKGGLPRKDWEALLARARKVADDAGFLRLGLPVEFGGQGASNLWMAVIREHLAARGLGLHNDLQNEHSIVANFPQVIMFRDHGNEAQRNEFIAGQLDGTRWCAFGLTEPFHGSDATHMETRAVRETRDGVAGWRIDGAKMWTTGMHIATHVLMFARTSGNDGDARGITCFICPTSDPGIKIEEWLWTFNMPTDHPRISVTNVWVPDSAIFGAPEGGLALAQSFVHENRIRQAASGLGAATYCIEESVKFARRRKPFGQPLSDNQAIQWPLVELATQAEMLRQLIYKTAWQMDRMDQREIAARLSDKVSMCNYFGNRLICDAADRAMQIHGGLGYSRHKPFEHMYRHHRRYRITEGTEEIQMRKVAGYLFGYMGPKKKLYAEMDFDTRQGEREL
ncbi:MAG: acyl-CoA dehydrogenase family protein [Burkholderiales bacterium]